MVVMMMMILMMAMMLMVMMVIIMMMMMMLCCHVMSSHVTIIFIRAVVREVLYRSSSLHDMRHDGQSVFICTYIYQCIKIQFITIMLSSSQSGG